MKHASVGAKKRSGKSMAGKIRHITIEPAENGFISRTHRHPENPKDMYSMPEPEPSVHEDADAVGAHVVSELGGSMKSGKEASKKAAGKGKVAASEAKAGKNETPLRAEDEGDEDEDGD